MDFEAVIDALYPAQQQLAREIKRMVFSPQEWRGNLRERNPFAMDAFAGKKILLIGEEHEPAELGGVSLEQISLITEITSTREDVRLPLGLRAGRRKTAQPQYCGL